jgi:broad specificity phosphatase PhoE
LIFYLGEISGEFMRKASVMIALFLFIQSIAFSAEKVTTVILTRHAEKATAPADDPALSAIGKDRADLLVKMLEKSGVSAIYSSQYARNRLTAEPLARKLGIPVETVNAEATNKLVASILSKHAGGTVLVVCHSNTLPEIVQALGGGSIPEIDDLDYNNLYIVNIYGKNRASVLRLQYFNPATSEVCQ